MRQTKGLFGGILKSNEATARIKIDRLLREAGWRLEDGQNGKANVEVECSVKSLEPDYQNAPNGRVDYVLLDSQKKPVAVLEAKRSGEKLLDKNSGEELLARAQDQVQRYARDKGVNIALMSNGDTHYFWKNPNGEKQGIPEQISRFPSPESIDAVKTFNPDKRKIADENITEGYLEVEGKKLYKHQVKAIKSIQESIKKGEERFLLEMATGSGKTRTCAGIIKLFFNTGNIRRCLFLVDRIELEDQAKKSLKRAFEGKREILKYKDCKNNWAQADILICTVQTLLSHERYRGFSPTDFDLVISDEAHRSLGIRFKIVFEYFLGFKLGLTATPKNYLRNVNVTDLSKNNPKNLEEREIRDTYRIFNCDSGEATYRYSLEDGVKEGRLVGMKSIDARTRISSELLSEDGFKHVYRNEDGDIEQEVYFKDKHFEKKFFSEPSNDIFCDTLLEEAQKDPLTGEIGKTIVFCVNQAHASKITQALNKKAKNKWGDIYGNNFAKQISSWVDNANKKSEDFSENILEGRTCFNKNFPNYKSSKVRICVTVGMMTTGYDCPDLLNIVLLRPIRSVSQYVQIKGRGTRKYEFSYINKFDKPEKENKEYFTLIDFFGNYQYFESDEPYTKVLRINPTSSTSEGGEDQPHLSDVSKEYHNLNKDYIRSVKKEDISHTRADEEAFKSIKRNLEEDSFIRQRVDIEDDLPLIKDYVRNSIPHDLEKIQEYINKERLTDRKVGLGEVILKILKKDFILKTKDEWVQKQAEEWVQMEKPDESTSLASKRLIYSYITDPEIKKILEDKKFGLLDRNPNFTKNDYRKIDENLFKKIKDYCENYFRWGF